VSTPAIRTERLGRQHWIDAALRTLAGQGVDAVRVERLAAGLKVTKGSFYWHFANREALLLALLEAWEARATNDIIKMVEAVGGDAKARMGTLGMQVFGSDGRLDRQIRAWSAHDPLARVAQARIDARRLAYLEQLLGEMGFAPDAARARALFSYQALVGQFAMADDARLTGGQLDHVFAMLVRR
jgi:AcrR family transcriptional regulator